MVNVSIPKPAGGTKMGWARLNDRQVYDFAIVSVAAAFTPDCGDWRAGRIVLGGVAPVPHRAKGVDDALKRKDDKATIRQAVTQVRPGDRPMSLNAYKVDLVQGLIECTALQAIV
jgi:xanthine dehydrogenase YagS FAD-binding subunit